MAQPAVIWHGTQQESAELLAAIARYCACQYDSSGSSILRHCEAHTALLESQRFLDGMLLMRWYFARYQPNAAQRVIRSTDQVGEVPN